MKFAIHTILSMPIDGASSHLLVINSEIKILLDCGISHTFNFQKYLARAQQLKTVRLVLVSHSQLEYSGALAFLVDQLGLNPKIFYTTQSVMRYSPLNVHEQLLGLRSKNYSKKNFNRIYKIYESINIMKPQQKKYIDLQQAQNEQQSSMQAQNNNTNPVLNQNLSQMQAEQQQPTIGQVQKIIYFTCFLAGSHMGSLAWRLNFGIVNILYMVQYNNYSLHHINGLDLSQVMQPTDILITDTYPNIDDSYMKKSHMYQRLKDVLMRFYQKNGISFTKPPMMTNIENEKKLLISCYPNQMLVEVMEVVKKIIEDMQPPESREKIRVIHLSSRFLQLIKSQMDYFSAPFKDTLQNLQQFFAHSKTISGRINLTTLQSLDGLLSDSINKSVQIYHIGEQLSSHTLQKARLQAQQNILKFRILTIQDKLIHSSSKIDLQQNEQKQILAQKAQESEISQQKQITISQVPDQLQIVPDANQKQAQTYHGKYFSLAYGFPRFVSKVQMEQQQQTYDQYGARHQYRRFQNEKVVQDEKKQNVGDQMVPSSLQKKNSTIEVMNIEFKIPPSDRLVVVDYSKINYIPFYSNKTNFNSSLQLIMTLKPDNVIILNTKGTSNELNNSYKKIYNSQQHTKQIIMYELAPKHTKILKIDNQLISYKVNYIPIPQQRKLQKVKGLITYSDKGLLYIHLDCLEEKEHLEFRLDKFYKKVKNSDAHECIFTKKGLIIDGVKIYRDEKRIILQGEYSQEYFKVRKLLYEFLKME